MPVVFGSDRRIEKSLNAEGRREMTKHGVVRACHVFARWSAYPSQRVARKIGTTIGGRNDEVIVHSSLVGGSAGPSLPQVPSLAAVVRCFWNGHESLSSQGAAIICLMVPEYDLVYESQFWWCAARARRSSNSTCLTPIKEYRFAKWLAYLPRQLAAARFRLPVGQDR